MGSEDAEEVIEVVEDLLEGNTDDVAPVTENDDAASDQGGEEDAASDDQPEEGGRHAHLLEPNPHEDILQELKGTVAELAKGVDNYFDAREVRGSLLSEMVHMQEVKKRELAEIQFRVQTLKNKIDVKDAALEQIELSFDRRHEELDDVEEDLDQREADLDECDAGGPEVALQKKQEVWTAQEEEANAKASELEETLAPIELELEETKRKAARKAMGISSKKVQRLAQQAKPEFVERLEKLRVEVPPLSKERRALTRRCAAQPLV